MTIDEVKSNLKQNIENGTAEANFRSLGLTDEQVEACLNSCKKAIEGYFGDEIFSTESNQHLKALIEYRENIRNE